MADATIHDPDVLVVGAGPAGIAAACVAAEAGRRVVVLDDNPGAGGQIWRGGPVAGRGDAAAAWCARLVASGARVCTSAAVVDVGPGECRRSSSRGSTWRGGGSWSRGAARCCWRWPICSS